MPRTRGICLKAAADAPKSNPGGLGILQFGANPTSHLRPPRLVGGDRPVIGKSLHIQTQRACSKLRLNERISSPQRSGGVNTVIATTVMSKETNLFHKYLRRLCFHPLIMLLHRHFIFPGATFAPVLSRISKFWKSQTDVFVDIHVDAALETKETCTDILFFRSKHKEQFKNILRQLSCYFTHFGAFVFSFLLTQFLWKTSSLRNCAGESGEEVVEENLVRFLFANSHFQYPVRCLIEKGFVLDFV